MEVVQVKFVTQVQNSGKIFTIPRKVQEILDILKYEVDNYDFIIEVASSKGTKTAATRTTSGGETKQADFSDHIEPGETITVTISKV